MIEWVHSLLSNEEMRGMGHSQRLADDNLGLGWLYYSLARIQRCRIAVVIGSYRGFVPLVIAKGMADNEDPGEVLFIDPSYWDDFWKNPVEVQAHFNGFGIYNIRHCLATTQEFVQMEAYDSLDNVGLLFIDGHHTYEQVKFDYEAFQSKLSGDGVVMLHDSMSLSPETYGGIRDLHITGVTFFVDELQADPGCQVFDFPRIQTESLFATGLTLVRRKAVRNSEYFRNPIMPGYESLRKGIDLFNGGHALNAVEHFGELIKLQPSFAAAWLLKGTALVSSGATAEGLKCLERAKELGHRRANGLIATIQKAMQRSNQAEENL